MNDHPQHPAQAGDELESLLTTLLDGELSERDEQRLMQLVIDDASARQRYLDIMEVHATLQWEQQWEAKPAPAEAPPVAQLIRDEATVGRIEPRSASRWLRVAAVVALLVIGFVATYRLLNRPTTDGALVDSSAIDTEPVAMLAETDNAIWADDAGIDSDMLRDGSDLGAGDLRLLGGRTQIVFRSGAVATLIGRTDLRMLDENRCRLTRGRVLAYVPPSATGFAIETPGMTVTDRGTRFGVTVAPDGAEEVHVFEGVVDVEATTRTQRFSRRLTADEALRVDAVGDRAEAIVADAQRFEHRALLHDGFADDGWPQRWHAAGQVVKPARVDDAPLTPDGGGYLRVATHDVHGTQVGQLRRPFTLPADADPAAPYAVELSVRVKAIGTEGRFAVFEADRAMAGTSAHDRWEISASWAPGRPARWAFAEGHGPTGEGAARLAVTDMPLRPGRTYHLRVVVHPADRRWEARISDGDRVVDSGAITARRLEFRTTQPTTPHTLHVGGADTTLDPFVFELDDFRVEMLD